MEGDIYYSKPLVFKTEQNNASVGHARVKVLTLRLRVRELRADWARHQGALSRVAWLQGQYRAGQGQCGLRYRRKAFEQPSPLDLWALISVKGSFVSLSTLTA